MMRCSSKRCILFVIFVKVLVLYYIGMVVYVTVKHQSHTPSPTNVSSNSVFLDASPCDSITKLVFLVPSELKNSAQRQFIRSTYGRCALLKYSPFRVIFYVGATSPNVVNSSLPDEYLNEYRLYHDLVFDATFHDTYRNLTLKVLHSLQWQQLYCSTAKVILKVDDDVFVFVDRLVKHLSNYSQDPQPFILGYKARSLMPIRKVGHRWYVSEQEYPESRYPAYVSGHAYILSQETVKYVLQNYTRYQQILASQKKILLTMEDVFVTGMMLVNATGVRRIYSTDVMCPMDCDMSPDILTVHRMDKKYVPTGKIALHDECTQIYHLVEKL